MSEIYARQSIKGIVTEFPRLYFLCAVNRFPYSPLRTSTIFLLSNDSLNGRIKYDNFRCSREDVCQGLKLADKNCLSLLRCFTVVFYYGVLPRYILMRQLQRCFTAVFYRSALQLCFTAVPYSCGLPQCLTAVFPVKYINTVFFSYCSVSSAYQRASCHNSVVSRYYDRWQLCNPYERVRITLFESK